MPGGSSRRYLRELREQGLGLVAEHRSLTPFYSFSA
jgi:hypothetical protein